MSMIIGLTGGIGSGKSTVSSIFKKLGIDVVDADIVAREVVQKGKPALAEIAHYFGSEVVEQGILNRAKLRQIIFADESKKVWLNELLHPLIRQEMLQQLENASSEYVLLEAPLLFENSLEKYCEQVLVVDIDERSQINRAALRDDCSEEQVKAIINSQISREQRLTKANFVIDNSSSSLQQLENLVIALDKQLRALQ